MGVKDWETERGRRRAGGREQGRWRERLKREREEVKDGLSKSVTKKNFLNSSLCKDRVMEQRHRVGEEGWGME